MGLPVLLNIGAAGAAAATGVPGIAGRAAGIPADGVIAVGAILGVGDL